MALIKLGAMFSAISGKVGGQSISRRAQTTTLRNITYTNKTPTQKQSIQRFITSGIANAYRFLSVINMSSWVATAFNYTYINRVGDTVTRNAYQVYSFCNQNLHLIGVAPLSSAPLYVPVTQPKINIIDISSGNFEIQSNNSSSAYLYALFAAPNLSNGTSNAVSRMKFCGTVTSAQLLAGHDVITQVESVYGSLTFPNKISIIVDPINQTTGNRSQEITEIFNEDLPFIIELTVLAGDTVTMPFRFGGVFSGSINWADGVTTSFTTYNSGGASHTFTVGGVYKVQIFGLCTYFENDNINLNTYLTDIIQFGSSGFTRLNFYGCLSLVNPTPINTPTFLINCSLEDLFLNCTNFINMSNINSWDVSIVKSLKESFRNCTNFASDLSSWKPSSCSNFQQMFRSSSSFNSDLSLWNVDAGTDFNTMFNQALLFNSDLSGWNITNANSMANFANNANFTNVQWDAMLIAWAGLTTPPSNIIISINATHTITANTAFTTLTTTYSWTINENL